MRKVYISSLILSLHSGAPKGNSTVARVNSCLAVFSVSIIWLLIVSLVAQGQTATTQTQTLQTQTPAKPGEASKKTPQRSSGELQKALQEFRVQVGQLIGTGGKVKGAGKQNALTGRIYEYLRNDALDAIPHEVRQRGGTKSLLRRNQFGFNVSGPVVVPRLLDGHGKTFFSLSYEGTRERIAQSALFTVPTNKQRNGDFSDLVDNAGQPVTIYDPATTRLNPNYDPTQPVSTNNLQYLRDPFPNNVIPADRIDRVARALVALYPQPNIAVGPFLQNNYWINSPFENRADGIIGKLDHALTEKQQLSLNLRLSRGLRKSPEYFPGPANSGSPSYNYDSRAVSLQDTFTASPQTVWEFRLSALHNLTSSLELEQREQDFPRQLGLQGLFSTSFPRFSFGTYLPVGPHPTSVFRDSNYSYSASTSVSIKKEAHMLKFAAIARRSFVNAYSPWAPAGFFTFGNALTGLPGMKNTGNAFAQFLLGMVTRAEESVVLHPSYYRRNSFEISANDEYRVRSGLTAEIGLSLEMATPRVEKYNRQSTVSFDHINPENGRPGALIFAGRDGTRRGLQPFTARLEPNFGLAINPWNDRKTVVRLGLGLTYQDYPLYGRHFGTQGFNATPLFTSANDQLQPAFRLHSGMPQNFPLPPQINPAAANGTDAEYIDRSGLLPATQHWHVALQRELPYSLNIEVAYNGLRGTHQFVDNLVRLNGVPVENLRYGDQLYNDAFRNSLRPYPQYRNLELGGVYPGGDVRGNSLVVTLDKRLSGGLYGRATYRLSKQIENISSFGAQDPGNLRAEMSLSPWDVTHALEVSYTYQLPFGRGKLLFNGGGWTSRILGGWTISGLTTLRGGQPLQLRPLFNRTGGIVNNLRVNVVPGVNPRVDNPTPERWFNPAAFAQPEDFTLGNASRTHPQLRGPSEQFHHLSLAKRVKLSDDTSLEILTEAFNFPNHANLNDPDTRIGSATNPNLNAGKIIGSTGGRVMQLGVRILF